MKDYGTGYWKFFNALCRFVGAGFVLVGGIVGIYGLTQKDGLTAGAGLVTAVLGVLLLLAKPYRPDGNDSEN